MYNKYFNLKLFINNKYEFIIYILALSLSLSF